MHRLRISVQALSSFLTLALLMIVLGCGGGGGGGGAAPTYTISGAVSGATQAGVTINLTGAAIASTTTAADGTFSFTGRANGTYTITPVKPDYIFNPVSTVVIVSGANVTGVNFVATANTDPTYSLSGTVSGAVQAGVLITLGGDAAGTAITDAGGNYSFPGLPAGNYSVTPSRTGYDFTPSTRLVTISGNSTGNDFTAAPTPEPTYNISGTVSGAIVEGVTIQLTGPATASTTTDAGGNYTLSGVHNGIYTVTPVKDGYTFNPASTAVNVNGANQTGKNFVATKIPGKFTVSGAVSGDILGGVTITLSGGASGSTTTNASGNYSFSNVSEGSICTVTPSAPGYTFAPASRNITVTGDITVGDFAATAKPSVTWKEYVLTTSASSAGWRRRTLRFADANPAILFAASSCLNSSGSTTCPAAGSLTWTTTGNVITESGASADTNVHMTLTSTGNFIAGTGNAGSSELRVSLKVLPAAVYSTADIQSKSFVFHELIVGSETKWRYGRGSTDGAGAVTLTSKTDPSGTIATPDTSWGNFVVDATGAVAVSGIPTFSGFLADDKKTIVGTYTNGGTYRLMILQITARSDYPVGPLPASVWKSSILAKSTPVPVVGVQAGWVYCTNTVDASGNMSFGTDWTSDNSQFQSNRPTTSFTGSLSATGEVTMSGGSDYHGQASDDWNFLIGTMTTSQVVFGSTIYIYFLQISTR
ncbi:MAG: hypothetical protein EG826_08005 [Deltaproteobacteria bacterium]|nr:hypothetical protein [Deltaproteobacteria bacterium]